jgi:hypothetical protein
MENPPSDLYANPKLGTFHFQLRQDKLGNGRLAVRPGDLEVTVRIPHLAIRACETSDEIDIGVGLVADDNSDLGD